MRRVAAELSPRYPHVMFVFARAYNQPRTLDRSDGKGTFTIPGVVPDPRGFPLTHVRRFLAIAYRDDEQPDDLVVMFHPSGGFSWIRQSETPGQG
jgi:hypothetical protein